MARPRVATTDVTTLPIGREIAAWRRALAANNMSPKTIRAYTDAATLFADFLAKSELPTELREIRREHVEAFIADQLARYKPASAHNRYRGLQAFWKYAVGDAGGASGRRSCGRLAGSRSRPGRGRESRDKRPHLVPPVFKVTAQLGSGLRVRTQTELRSSTPKAAS